MGLIDFLKYETRTYLEMLMSHVTLAAPKSSLFPYEFYDNETSIFYDADSIGFILDADLMAGCGGSEIKQIALIFEELLPQGGYIQFLLLSSDKTEYIFDDWRRARKYPDNILEKITDRRRDFFSKNKSLARDFRLIVSYGESKNKKINDKDFADQKTRIILFREKLVALFLSIGIEVRKFDANNLLELIAEVFGGEKQEYSSLKPINHQISSLDNSINIESDHIASEKQIRCYLPFKYPKEFSISHMISLLGEGNLNLPYNFMISYTVYNNVSSSKQEAMKNKGQNIIKQGESFFARFNLKLKEEAEEWQEIEKRIFKGHKLITSSFTVALMANSEDMEKAEQQLCSLYNVLGWRLKKCAYFMLPVLINMMPLVPASGLFQYLQQYGVARTALSSEPLAIAPLHGEWKGSLPCMLLVGRRGQLFNFDPFQGESNYNMCVVGQSGSGKSVFLQELVTSQLALGAHVFVLDIGRSFEKCCNLLGGDFTEFSTNSKVCLNPFSKIPKGNKAEEEDLLSMIKPIIAKMTSPKKGTGDIEDAFIAEVLKEAWNKYGNNTDITKIAELLSKKGAREKDLATMLFNFTEEGTYGRFFNGEANISFTKNLTVIEFEELRERRDLLEVIMQMISVQIMLQIFLSDRRKRHIILFDEAWLALGSFPELLENLARTVRKYNASLILGTQSLNDFYGSNKSASVLENCGWLGVMKQKRESIEMLRTAGRLSLDQARVETIYTLETRPGSFSEIMLSCSSGYVVGRLMLDTFSRILYSTKATEYRAVKDLINQGIEGSKAIEMVAEQIYGSEY